VVASTHAKGIESPATTRFVDPPTGDAGSDQGVRQDQGATPYREQNAALWSLVESEQKRRRHTNAEIAAALGMGTAYLSSLQSGTRAFASIGPKYLASFAHYIQQPLLNTMLMSGAIRVADLFIQETPERAAQRAFEMLVNDPVFGGWLPSQERWDSYPLDARLLIAALTFREQRGAWESIADALRAVGELAKESPQALNGPSAG
jgi:transcriptional regulator with XRE-family HTH domain